MTSRTFFKTKTNHITYLKHKMSQSCHDEHSHSHSHDHSHGGGGGGAHDHSDDLTPALQNLLHSQIDFDGIRTLNEAISGSGRAVCRKPWSQRLDPSPELSSDADEQLILHIPYVQKNPSALSPPPPSFFRGVVAHHA